MDTVGIALLDSVQVDSISLVIDSLSYFSADSIPVEINVDPIKESSESSFTNYAAILLSAVFGGFFAVGFQELMKYLKFKINQKKQIEILGFNLSEIDLKIEKYKGIFFTYQRLLDRILEEKNLFLSLDSLIDKFYKEISLKEIQSYPKEHYYSYLGKEKFRHLQFIIELIEDYIKNGWHQRFQETVELYKNELFSTKSFSTRLHSVKFNRTEKSVIKQQFSDMLKFYIETLDDLLLDIRKFRLHNPIDYKNEKDSIQNMLSKKIISYDK
jgi:hypothetical protein